MKIGILFYFIQSIKYSLAVIHLVACLLTRVVVTKQARAAAHSSDTDCSCRAFRGAHRGTILEALGKVAAAARRDQDEYKSVHEGGYNARLSGKEDSFASRGQCQQYTRA
jgi:hypothetical protein